MKIDHHLAIKGYATRESPLDSMGLERLSNPMLHSSEMERMKDTQLGNLQVG
jgi:hypothetical protein